MNPLSLGPDLSPYHEFTTAQWAALRHGEPMTLDLDDLKRLRALNDPISLEEAQQVYLPMTRLLAYYVEAVQGLHSAAGKFLQQNGDKTPFIIGVAGSVSVGKSTTARILHALMQRWPSSPKVDLVTTDGFLLPNAELERRGLMEKKGFPESYDRSAFLKFLASIKAGKPNVKAPTYSHLVYDVVPGEEIIVDRPNILIVEGLNILQPGDLPRDGRPILFASDFIDFSIYIDSEEPHLRQWYVERFLQLRETAFKDPQSFFHKFSKLSIEEAKTLAISIWEQINLPNLQENILPTRGRADLVLTKGPDHAINRVKLRKL